MAVPRKSSCSYRSLQPLKRLKSLREPPALKLVLVVTYLLTYRLPGVEGLLNHGR